MACFNDHFQLKRWKQQPLQKYYSGTSIVGELNVYVQLINPNENDANFDKFDNWKYFQSKLL